MKMREDTLLDDGMHEYGVYEDEYEDEVYKYDDEMYGYRAPILGYDEWIHYRGHGRYQAHDYRQMQEDMARADRRAHRHHQEELARHHEAEARRAHHAYQQERHAREYEQRARVAYREEQAAQAPDRGIILLQTVENAKPSDGL